MQVNPCVACEMFHLKNNNYEYEKSKTTDHHSV